MEYKCILILKRNLALKFIKSLARGRVRPNHICLAIEEVVKIALERLQSRILRLFAER